MPHDGLSKLNSMRTGAAGTSRGSGSVWVGTGQVRSTFQADRAWPAGEPRETKSHGRRHGAFPIGLPSGSFPRKEVIQPHLPVRLPCYDFTPVTSPTFDGSLPRGVRPPASGVAHSRGVTGGVYKARERIHRGNADPRLLATPPSSRRVSACYPNRDAL
jgi:hypothetical protein